MGRFSRSDDEWDVDTFIGEVETNSSHLIRMSPNLTKAIIRSSPNYMIINLEEPDAPVYVSLKVENLSFTFDYFFLTEELIAIPLLKKN